MNNRPQAFVGVDIGGTNIKVMSFSPEGRILFEERTATQDDSSGAWRERARALARSVIERSPKPAAVGVAAPGLPAADGLSIQCMPGRLPGLEGLNWQQWLSVDRTVPVFNDAHAALMGESWVGAAKGVANVVLLTLGTGVGGATMVDGRVLLGQSGRAGHLGHVSLNPEGPPDVANAPGSLEDAIGEHTVVARSGGRFKSTRELVEAFRADSPEAAEIWLRSVKALAAAIASFVNVLDPELIVIGGGIADADEALFQPLQSFLDKFEWRPTGAAAKVVKAVLGRNAGATGAAYGAKLMAVK